MEKKLRTFVGQKLYAKYADGSIDELTIKSTERDEYDPFIQYWQFEEAGAKAIYTNDYDRSCLFVGQSIHLEGIEYSLSKDNFRSDREKRKDEFYNVSKQEFAELLESKDVNWEQRLWDIAFQLASAWANPDITENLMRTATNEAKKLIKVYNDEKVKND